MGIAAGLASAALWAATNLILRGQLQRLGGAMANAWRTTFASLCFAVVFLLVRDPRDLFRIPPHTLAVLTASVLLSLVLGDIMQFTAINRIGVALAMPISASSPLFTLAIAAAYLDEDLSLRAVCGAAVVVVGVTLVAVPRRALVTAEHSRHREVTANHWIGVALALAAAICGSFSTTLMRVAITDLDTVVANMLRLPFSAVLCFIIGYFQRGLLPWQVGGRRNFGALFLAGLVSMVGGFLFLTTVKTLGAGKTATLNAAAPIFGLCGAVLFLGERPAPRNIAGAIIAFAGIALVV